MTTDATMSNLRRQIAAADAKLSTTRPASASAPAAAPRTHPRDFQARRAEIEQQSRAAWEHNAERCREKFPNVEAYTAAMLIRAKLQH